MSRVVWVGGGGKEGQLEEVVISEHEILRLRGWESESGVLETDDRRLARLELVH